MTSRFILHSLTVSSEFLFGFFVGPFNQGARRFLFVSLDIFCLRKTAKAFRLHHKDIKTEKFTVRKGVRTSAISTLCAHVDGLLQALSETSSPTPDYGIYPLKKAGERYNENIVIFELKRDKKPKKEGKSKSSTIPGKPGWNWRVPPSA